MKITQDKFAYLQAVVEEKNITRAAEKLFISQPALTSYINKIENYYGVKLFNRSQNPITLTYAGEQFMKGMNEIIQLQQKFDNDMEELANHRAGRITIGIGSTRGNAWLPYLLPAYKEQYPDIDIQIVEGNKEVLEHKLLKGSIDFFVSSLPISN
ncbi:MAG: LysR family transcriptional regulator, partial [Lachnospiraceae bacterium]|nr:LysR family transcriptional regulator [Lachnospiraceae bacterium]